MDEQKEILERVIRLDARVNNGLSKEIGEIKQLLEKICKAQEDSREKLIALETSFKEVERQVKNNSKAIQKWSLEFTQLKTKTAIYIVIASFIISAVITTIIVTPLRTLLWK